jgi:peptidyl-prolyl cis-trans isomerase C
MRPTIRTVQMVLTFTFTACLAWACGGDEARNAAPEADQATAPSLADGPAGTAGATTASMPPSAAKVASVNGTVITGSELDSAIESFLEKQGGQAVPPEQQEQVRKMVIDALIGRELLFQYSVSAGIQPSAEEIEQAFSGIRGRFETEEKWNAYLAEEGVDATQARGRVARNMAIDLVVQKQVIDKVTVPPAELRKFYDDNQSQMQRPEQVRASHILLRVALEAPEAEKDPIRARAGELLMQARQGADFAQLARDNSEDPGSGANGGDLGFFGRGDMVPPFEAATFALELNGISDIVETQFGYHIIKLTGRQPGGTVPFEEASARIEQFLKQQNVQSGVQNFVQGLRDKAEVETF